MPREKKGVTDNEFTKIYVQCSLLKKNYLDSKLKRNIVPNLIAFFFLLIEPLCGCTRIIVKLTKYLTKIKKNYYPGSQDIYRNMEREREREKSVILTYLYVDEEGRLIGTNDARMVGFRFL